MTFYTDQQTEAWLESQTRALIMPDGSSRPHTAFRLVWETADSLIEDDGHTMRELTACALEEASLQGMSFDKAFTGVVSWLDDQRRKDLGML